MNERRILSGIYTKDWRSCLRVYDAAEYCMSHILQLTGQMFDSDIIQWPSESIDDSIIKNHSIRMEN